MTPHAMQASPRGRSGSIVGAGALIVALVVCVALACSSNGQASGLLATCHQNSDCANDLVCALGACRAMCTTAADCGAGGACVDNGTSAVCQYQSEFDMPCNMPSDCPSPLACASDYRCRNLCSTAADCNVLGITGRVCATDANGVHYCATAPEVTSGVLTESPPPGAPDTGVIEPPDATSTTNGDAGDATIANGEDTGAPDAGSTGDSGADAATYALGFAPNAVHVVRGSSTSVSVTLAPAATANITAMVTGLPSGVQASSLSFLLGAAQSTLTLTASSTATLGAASVTVSVGGAMATLSIVVADPGTTLDVTFGNGGVQAFAPPSGSTNSTANAVVLLADGSMVLGGCRTGSTESGWSLAKVSNAGAIDTAFGTAATATLPSTGCVYALATDGTNIYVAGDDASSTAVGQATLYVVTPSGSLYLAFMSAGSWQITLSSATANGTSARAVAPAANGDVYVAVNQDTTGAANKPSYLFRLAPNGTTNQLPLSNTTTVFGMGVDPTGNVVAGGQLGANTFYAQRFDTSGNLAVDTAFGGTGGVLGAASADLYGATAAMDVEGGIYVAGEGTASGEVPLLGHVNAAGRADLGDAGWCAVNVSVQFNVGFVSIATQSDGRLWGIGYGSDEMGNIPWIVRTTGTCALDPSWNDGGVFRSLTNTEVTYKAIAVYPPPDGRLVVVGNDPALGFYAARYWP
jgi:hypothetical protein